MKTIAKYMVVLLLLTIASPFVIAAGSSSVTAYTGAILLGENNSTLTIAPFYAPIFGVHIFAGSEPVGAYWLNNNTSYVYHPLLHAPY